MDRDNLPPEAIRALAEAQARRQARDTEDARRKKAAQEKDPDEQGGPKGPEPTRYGDWERKGLCVDF